MDEVVALRRLVPGDEPLLFEFLSQYVESSLFFFSNVERVGLVDHGERFQGTYVASFDAAGAITAVAGHSWTGTLLLQGDRGLEQAARRAVELTGRKVGGLIGPWSLVCRARRALGLEETRAGHDGAELLFALSLDALRLPALLSQGGVALRPPTAAEASGVLSGWRFDYQVETLGLARTPEQELRARRDTEGWREAGNLWVLTVNGQIVAMTGFNAETRGMVQVGGVFTPPSLRGRGYARAAVAASLAQARDKGAQRSILFTAKSNQAAQRAYTALGYEVIGDFGLVLF
ncbi:MAG TPA: GNAT family N-acetyltransferase [Polyangiaceae bacterium]|nr:GNAT family N-acetyltransferase [Polyangiaceae bacterium]